MGAKNLVLIRPFALLSLLGLWNSSCLSSSEESAGGEAASVGSSLPSNSLQLSPDEIGIHHVQAMARDTFSSGIAGDFFSLAYTVPVDGLLVVSTGTRGASLVPSSVDFVKQNGTVRLSVPAYTLGSVTAAAAPGQQFSVAIGNQLYYLPVNEGDTGTIEVRYTGGHWATSRSGVIASTLTGVSQVQTVVTSTIFNTSSISGQVTLAEDSIVISSLKSDGWTTLEPSGTDHVMDAQPMQPLQVFHSSRHALGHAFHGLGTHTLGYTNTAGNFYNAVLIVAAFSAGP